MDIRVHIALHPSRAYFFLLLALVLISILTISVLPITAGWRWLGYLAVSVGAIWLFARDIALLSGRSCLSFVCGKDRYISLALRNGEQISGVVCADTLVSPRLILLNVATVGHGGRSLLLFPDAMGGEDHRRLRVLLRNLETPQS